MPKMEYEPPLKPNTSNPNRDKTEHEERKSDGTAAFGCLIMIFGGCASIGGLLHFIQVVVNLIKTM